MKFIIHCILISFIFIGCSSEPKSAKEIIDKSIAFHDQHHQWKDLNAEFKFDSRFTIATFPIETLEISINIPTNEFQYVNSKRNINVKYSNDTCFSPSCDGTCKAYSWTKGFYPYIWGLPMKLTDPGYSPEKEWQESNFNNSKCYAVDMHYENENFTFYFDQVSYQLKGFKFIKNEDSSHGEIVKLNNLYTFEGIQFPAHRTWLKLDSSLIGTNEVLNIKKL